MLIMFSFEVEIFRGERFSVSIVSLVTEGTNSKLLTGNISTSPVTSFSGRALGFLAVWERHCLVSNLLRFLRSSVLFTRFTPRVLSGSLCCSPRLRDVNADTEVSECCDGKANSTLGYPMLVCWGP